MRAERFALPVSALALAFSALALPLTYVAVPFCRPPATLADLGATVLVASGASVMSLSGLFLALLSIHALGTVRSRVSLALASGSLAISLIFITFGLTLRTCPA